jgi:hypothetical protein
MTKPRPESPLSASALVKAVRTAIAPEDPADVDRIVESIKPLLAGHAPEIQSAVIAELLAIWLHGHQSLDPKKLSLRNLKQFRAEMLHRHVEFVRELVEIYDRKPSEEPAQ